MSDFPFKPSHDTPGILLFFIGIIGLVWAVFMIAYYLIGLTIQLIRLVFSLCRLALIALSPSPKSSPQP